MQPTIAGRRFSVLPPISYSIGVSMNIFGDKMSNKQQYLGMGAATMDLAHGSRSTFVIFRARDKNPRWQISLIFRPARVFFGLVSARCSLSIV